jgi:hypothetical protein
LIWQKNVAVVGYFLFLIRFAKKDNTISNKKLLSIVNKNKAISNPKQHPINKNKIISNPKQHPINKNKTISNPKQHPINKI